MIEIFEVIKNKILEMSGNVKVEDILKKLEDPWGYSQMEPFMSQWFSKQIATIRGILVNDTGMLYKSLAFRWKYEIAKSVVVWEFIVYNKKDLYGRTAFVKDMMLSYLVSGVKDNEDIDKNDIELLKMMIEDMNWFLSK